MSINLVSIIILVLVFLSTPTIVLADCMKKDLINANSETGKIFISPQYDFATRFRNGHAVVIIHDKSGLIDKNNNFIIQPIFDSLWWDIYLNTKLVPAKVGGKKGKWGLVNFDSKFVVNPIYESIQPYTDNKEKIFFKAELGRNQYKYEYFDENGIKLNIVPELKISASNILEVKIDLGTKKYGLYNQIENLFSVPPSFDEIHNLFCNNLFAVKIGDDISGVWGVIDAKGKMIITPQFAEIGRQYTEGLLPVNFGSKFSAMWGFVDEAGNTIIQPEFEEIAYFSQGLAGVKKDGKCGYIDRTGKYIIQPIFDPIKFEEGEKGFCAPFEEGLVVFSKNKKMGYLKR